MTSARRTLAAATQAILAALVGCSGEGGTTGPRCAVGGVVSGLAGQGLVLRLNGGADLAIAANGPFAFPARLAVGAAYSVSASSQPDGHLCTVAKASGTVSGADVTDVAVTCVVGRKLVASDGAPDAMFGRALATSSDGSVVAVGAIGVGYGAGAAYVYRWNGSGWDELRLAADANAASDEWFGMAVATSADGGLLVVGAPGDAVGTNSRQGSARVYRWTGSGYAAEATLTASDGAANAWFGYSLALTPDGSTLVVGAPKDDGAATTDQGSAYVFRWNGSSFEEARKLTASDGATYDNLGTSVAVSAGGNTVLAGAPYHDVGANAGQGAAYLYAWDGSTWNETELTASDGGAGEYFGEAVALSADGGAAAVGMPFHSTGTIYNHGSAYLYRDGGMGWTETTTTPSDLDKLDLYGCALAMSAGGARLVVGAYQGGGALDRGAVYVNDAAGGGRSVARIVAAGGVAGDELGHSVAVSPDGSTVVAGAPLAAVGANANQGFVLVFR